MEPIARIARELDGLEADLTDHTPLRTRRQHHAELRLLDGLVRELDRVDRDLHLLRRARESEAEAIATEQDYADRDLHLLRARESEAEAIATEQDYADRLRTRVLHRRSRLQGAALARIESFGAIVTVAFLLPTLVAAVYGADAAIPGRGLTETLGAWVIFASLGLGLVLAVILWLLARGGDREDP